jgi:HD-GYP domain-containing protein (c-di-GMP phosphodiesterase class II)
MGGKGMLMENIDRIDEIVSSEAKIYTLAKSQDWQELADGTLDLLLATCQADAAALFCPQSFTHPITVRGMLEYTHLIEWDSLWYNLLSSGLLKQECPRMLTDEAVLPHIEGHTENLIHLQNMALIPLLRTSETPVTFVLMNTRSSGLEVARHIAYRMISELEKADTIVRKEQHEQRLKEIMEIEDQMAASFDADQVMRILLERSRQFLKVEASSLFLVDEEQGDIVLEMASQQDKQFEKIRVPFGKGIIGYVVEHGETLVVGNVHQDKRHYQGVDQSSGFQTRSILAVPLVAQQINLGSGLGVSKEKIIGGLEAINKMEGTFQPEDVELMQMLARKAATVWQISRLYTDANQMFDGFIRAIVKTIDMKDPYTEEHSLRVSEFSVVIAQELGLSQELIGHVKRGSLLHDVGKVLVPDSILKNPGRLKPEEYNEMKKHPAIGEKIIAEVGKLEIELPAISAHHEKLDGTGYPYGLAGDEIPLFGRIVAVADVFDALTSDRPYRPGSSAAEIFDYLRKNIGNHFDSNCVHALIRAYDKGVICPQSERSQE